MTPDERELEQQRLIAEYLVQHRRANQSLFSAARALLTVVTLPRRRGHIPVRLPRPQTSRPLDHTPVESPLGNDRSLQIESM